MGGGDALPDKQPKRKVVPPDVFYGHYRNPHQPDKKETKQ